MYSRKSVIKYIFSSLNEEKVQIIKMVPSLNLHDLIFPPSALSYCDVIATFADQQPVDTRSYQREIGTC